MPEENPLPQAIDRRKALHTLSATALAAAAFPAGVRAAETREKPLKVGLIGCGGRGTGATAQALTADASTTLWALADVDQAQIDLSKQVISKQFSESPETPHRRVDVPPERQYVGLDAFQRALADPELDVVILTTPPGFRPQHFEAAIAAGKHAFIEKPVAADSAGVRRVMETAREADRKNLKVGVGLNRRHSPLHETVMDHVHGGAIGDILTYRQYNLRGQPKRPKELPAGMGELERQIRNWYHFSWLSGDFIVEQSVHDFDVAHWLMNEESPVRCQGQGGRLVRTGVEHGNVYDHFSVEYEYADGRKVNTQHRHMNGNHNQFGIEIEGSKGRASVLSKSSGLVEVFGKSEPLWRGRETGNSYQVEHDLLFKAIREDLPWNEAERGARATLVAMMGRLAAYTGKPVTYEEALADDSIVVPDFASWDDVPPVTLNAEGYYSYPLPGV
jgi:myo-inositol 2-dehydrogenase/D-chiro-inositol 1-dehydrogenase